MAPIVGGTEVPPTDSLVGQALNFRALYDPKVLKKDKEVITIYKSSQCSASAIASRLLLTAAHCISSHPDAEHRLQIKPVHGADIVIKALKAVRHPEYINGNKQYDLALVLLESEVPEELVQIMMLPRKDLPLALTKVTAAGYGRMDGRPAFPGHSGTLRTVQLNVTKYTPESPVFIVDHSQGKGFCQGDSGGPALAEIAGVVGVVGIASKTFYDNTLPKEQWNLCNGSGEYINVQFHSDWIVTTAAELISEP